MIEADADIAKLLQPVRGPPAQLSPLIGVRKGVALQKLLVALHPWDVRVSKQRNPRRLE
jgi:hypothetical protein